MRAIWFYVVVVAMLALFLGPVWYAVVSSFATDQTQFAPPLWPVLQWQNYRAVLEIGGFGRSLVNSVLVACGVVGGSLGVALLAAYALARVRFAGRGVLLCTILAVSMFPQVAVLAGMFEMMRALGLYNSLWAVGLAQAAFTLPFTVWLLTVFLRGLPVEIEEAAVIDGATPWVLIRVIFLPLLAPAMASVGLLAFIGSWNEFLFALTLTISEDMRTAPVAVTMISPMAFNQAAAGAVLVTAPMVGLVLLFQRRIVAGLAAGSLVG